MSAEALEVDVVVHVEGLGKHSIEFIGVHDQVSVGMSYVCVHLFFAESLRLALRLRPFPARLT